MAHSLKPFVGCNLGCEYCYEADIRHAGNAKKQYDLEALKSAMVREWGKHSAFPIMHGGEFLLMPKADAEQLFALSFELAGQGGIQTNGTLIDDDWIAMFKKYNVYVGVSVDGPGELNRARWAGSLAKTDATTEKIMANIRKMREADVLVSIICVVNKLHVTTPNAMQLMKDWILELKDIGVTGGRINQVEVDDPALRDKYELTTDELGHIFKEIGDLCLTEPGLYWQPFRDIQDMLLGLSIGTCVFTGCDPLATEGEHVIMPKGQMGNCLKTAKEGVEYLFAEGGEGRERSDLLFNTPYEYGGCKGCRYWKVCRGHCPSEAIDGDYRNRSRYCTAHYGIYERIENRMKALLPNLRTICDVNDIQPEDYELRRKSKGTFEAFALLTKVGTWTPSAWRATAWDYVKNKEFPLFPNGVDPTKEYLSEMIPGDHQHADAPHGDVAHGDVGHSDMIDVDGTTDSVEHTAPDVIQAMWEKI